MNVIAILLPAALTLGGIGLLAFIWSLKSNQFDDLDGEAQRILIDRPAGPPTARRRAGGKSADR